MKNNKKIAVIVIANILIIGLICSFINIKVNVVKEKQIIKEMSESTQVSNLQTQINTLNKEHTDYANYIQTCKNSIATALTNEKVATSGNDTLETMSANIGKVLQARTADATATESDILEGKTAYVNGKLIKGNANRGSIISFSCTPISLYIDNDTGKRPSNNIHYEHVDISKVSKIKLNVSSISQGTVATYGYFYYELDGIIKCIKIPMGQTPAIPNELKDIILDVSNIKDFYFWVVSNNFTYCRTEISLL